MDTVVDISGCADKDVVKFISQSFKGEALAWWRSLIQATRKIPLYNLSWDQFVALIKENYCPQHEVEKIESDFLLLVMKNLDCQAYLTSFNTMSRQRSLRNTDAEKGKREDDNSRRSEKKHKGNNDHKKVSGSKKEGQQMGDKPKCKICKKHYFGKCIYESKSQSQPRACGICKSSEHKTLDCKKIKDATCYNCNKKGHIKSNCPKFAKKAEEGKKTNARVFQMNTQEAIQNDNVITALANSGGSFLLAEMSVSGESKTIESVSEQFVEIKREDVGGSTDESCLSDGVDSGCEDVEKGVGIEVEDG
ncbi:uncharacterized protein LOC110931179 [Helianthus annuus]|uniref:uncharacterized protein LOC110931179 n=1 Tax=Helianthus annuus TaxID=4232 RepID=UPI001653007D|nr:uncharacterized protein LOC110931179 [Helianthus annuus]